MMAASSPCYEHLTSRQESFNRIFTPLATTERPFDIRLVAQDGKEFKAHQKVLSQASPYFDRLLRSGMKEVKEGEVKLETFHGDAMGRFLEFIYTGNVEILSQEIAIELLMMGDYFVLPDLKSLAENFLLSLRNLTVSNCISSYYFAERYKLSELTAKIESFIHANFAIVAKTEEFMNLSKEDVEMWISRDEIHVSAEEDVFEIILAWIYFDKSERKKHFTELFRQVRLAYVSRDSLCSDLAKNDFVKQNQECLERVKHARLSPYKNCEHIFLRPRKSLETPLIVVCAETYILCYFPRENRWCEFANTAITNLRDCELASCSGRLYLLNPLDFELETGLLRYDSLSNSWRTLPYKENRYLKQIFVRNDNEMFALVTEACYDCENLSCLCCRGIRGEPPSSKRRKLMSSITKYSPESNSWTDIASFDFGLREGICIVTVGQFVYFIGGGVLVQEKSIKDAERYDLTTDRWDKLADIHEERIFACGAASHGKIFVVGGLNTRAGRVSTTCEVYNEKTNEWYFVASLIYSPGVLSRMVCVDGKLYVVGECLDPHSEIETGNIQCYDPEKNEWNEDIKIPICMKRRSRLVYRCNLNACAMRVFRGFVGNLDIKPTSRCAGLRDKLKCAIM